MSIEIFAVGGDARFAASLIAAAIDRSLRRVLSSMAPAVRRTALAASVFLLISGRAFAQQYKAGPLKLTHCWSCASTQRTEGGGGFLIIENAGDKPDRLLLIKAHPLGTTKISERAIADEVLRMPNGGVILPPHAVVTLNPSPFHLLIGDTANPMMTEQPFSATLIFESLGAVEVDLVAATSAFEELGRSESKSLAH